MTEGGMTVFTNTMESGLESLIVRWLVEHNGYEQGHSHDFNTEYALDTARLFRFLKNTQPDAVKKLQLETNPQKTAQFLAACATRSPSAALLMCCAKASRLIPPASSCSI